MCVCGGGRPRPGKLYVYVCVGGGKRIAATPLHTLKMFWYPRVHAKKKWLPATPLHRLKNVSRPAVHTKTMVPLPPPYLKRKLEKKKNGLKIEEEKNVSKWCVNLIKTSFTSKKNKKKFCFIFWAFSTFFLKKKPSTAKNENKVKNSQKNDKNKKKYLDHM